MTCPICGGKTKIYDSRPDEESVRRRRECVECGHRFITVEVDADLFERVEKNNVVEVVETKKVPENCATCMYGRMCGCTHADRQKDWKRYVDFTWLDNKCPSFHLDQDRYNAVKK